MKTVKSILNKLGLNFLSVDIDKFIQKTWFLPVDEEESHIRIDFIFSDIV